MSLNEDFHRFSVCREPEGDHDVHLFADIQKRRVFFDELNAEMYSDIVTGRGLCGVVDEYEDW